MGLQETRGDVKLQVEEWDTMEGDLSLQKLQLTLPDQFEECEELDQDGKAMEVWPTVERLTEDDLGTLDAVLQESNSQVEVYGLVQGTDEEWGENQPLVDQLRAARLKDYGDTVLCGKFSWINESPPIRGPHCEARIHLKVGAQAKAQKQIRLQGEKLQAMKEIAEGWVAAIGNTLAFG